MSFKNVAQTFPDSMDLFTHHDNHQLPIRGRFHSRLVLHQIMVNEIDLTYDKLTADTVVKDFLQGCCVFRLANGCSTPCSLVKIIFFYIVMSEY